MSIFKTHIRVILPEETAHLSLLSKAVLTDRPNIVKLVLQQENVANTQDNCSALHLACQIPINSTILLHLLCHSVDSDLFKKDKFAKIPADYAAKALERFPEHAVEGDVELVRNFVIMTSRLKDQKKPSLIRAVLQLDCSKYQIPLNNPEAAPNYQTSYHSDNLAVQARLVGFNYQRNIQLTMLQQAVIMGHDKIIRYLLQLGIDPNEVNPRNRTTAAHYVCQQPINTARLLWLLNNGCNYFVIDIDEKFPADYAKEVLNKNAENGIIGDKNIVIALIHITKAIAEFNDKTKAARYMKFAIEAHSEFTYTLISKYIENKNRYEILPCTALSANLTFNETDYKHCFRLAKLLSHLAKKTNNNTDEGKLAKAKFLYDSLVYATIAHQAFNMLITS